MLGIPVVLVCVRVSVICSKRVQCLARTFRASEEQERRKVEGRECVLMMVEGWGRWLDLGLVRWMWWTEGLLGCCVFDGKKILLTLSPQ
jgi:hypothetical protein